MRTLWSRRAPVSIIFDLFTALSPSPGILTIVSTSNDAPEEPCHAVLVVNSMFGVLVDELTLMELEAGASRRYMPLSLLRKRLLIDLRKRSKTDGVRTVLGLFDSGSQRLAVCLIDRLFR